MRQPAEHAGYPADPLWEHDAALQALLSSIVAEAAEAGVGARLVVSRDGRPRVLCSVRANRQPWRALARAVCDQGETQSATGVAAAPVLGIPALRAALLLYYDPIRGLDGAEHVAHAYATRVEMALELSRSHLASVHGAVEALFQALTAHDELMGRHSLIVRRLIRALGPTMDIAPHVLLEWEWAALLHDIGKIAVPQALLRKAGPLDSAEWALMSRHPGAGERIVRAVPALHPAALAVRHHHERWDGEGYPDRLAGPAIPLAARVIALVDAYETMCSGRPYRAPLDRAEALAELRRSTGRQFDPGLLPLLPVLAEQDLHP